jgi:DNA-binding transcriptional regulator LsrR (DeoR family)
MTNREFFNKVIAGEVDNEVVEMAQTLLAKLDEKNAKRKNTETKEQKENKVLMAKICDLLANGGMVASDIGKALGVSTQKASALCILLVKEGTVSVADVKVKGKGTVKCYTLDTPRIDEGELRHTIIID